MASHHQLGKQEGQKEYYRANVNTKKCDSVFSAVDRASWFMHTIIQALHVLCTTVCLYYTCLCEPVRPKAV